MKVSMKTKTSVTLSEVILAQVDQLVGRKQSRSAFLERVLRRYLREQTKATFYARDLALLNGAADQLTPEADEVKGVPHSTEPEVETFLASNVIQENLE
jgi:metal-responsive CopG/Arc/MetJ family transcriptional regulator